MVYKFILNVFKFDKCSEFNIKSKLYKTNCRYFTPKINKTNYFIKAIAVRYCLSKKPTEAQKSEQQWDFLFIKLYVLPI